MTAGLVAFLRARLDEDEQTAQAAAAGPWIRHEHVAGVHVDDGTEDRKYGTAVADCRRVRNGYGVPNALHIARHQPARVLAGVAALRSVLDLHDHPETSDGLPDSLNRFTSAVQRQVIGDVLRHLALPYADHPDYREEWRPGDGPVLQG
ncbi:hypothetical protein IPZ58_09440 [Streptomyces roseoverticillatus]|uniref:DUF6221 family protein n=1 Tax=Streptomyces roseoverticillatus TaxID=66429 RepID=UPI001F311EF2|nr:DUF6221 family protein [Streptomyces roseoverticillatus]MCF3101806.1 hypothetical protein [Streptomyces roseoverticillatus]